MNCLVSKAPEEGSQTRPSAIGRLFYSVMACLLCDNTGWVCEEHPDRPWRGTSQRADACDCVRVGMPCECNPCGGIDESPTLSPIARGNIRQERPAALMAGAE